MNKTAIDWGYGQLYTWNPVTGCRRGCSYCYARKIHERFYKTPFDEIVFHSDRNDTPPKKPSHIFVGSMSDIQYWKKDWVLKIIGYCLWHCQHTFMFLSKSAESYEGFIWPKNTMQGLTITGTENNMGSQMYAMLKLPRPFLSVEPLLGKNQYPFSGFEKVIVGAMTGPGAIVPEKEWIDSIIKTPGNVYWKPNIRKYL